MSGGRFKLAERGIPGSRVDLEKELARAWRDKQVAELRGIQRGKAIGRIQGFLVGSLGAAVLLVAAADILWKVR